VFGRGVRQGQANGSKLGCGRARGMEGKAGARRIEIRYLIYQQGVNAIRDRISRNGMLRCSDTGVIRGPGGAGSKAQDPEARPEAGGRTAFDRRSGPKQGGRGGPDRRVRNRAGPVRGAFRSGNGVGELA